MRVFEAFSGYGSQGLALKKNGIDYEIVGISEIDKYAIQAHEALHGPVKNYGDISKIDVTELPEMDLFTYSFPCQDISLAGNRRGLAKDSGTRSSLLWECERVIEAKKPKYLMMENVKALVGKKNKPHFEEWLSVLEELGYNNYWKVINAKHCGIPQNRERVFCVSILKEHDNGEFKFYDDFDNGIRLKDILEDQVDEKYYLSDEKSRGVVSQLKDNNYSYSTGINLSQQAKVVDKVVDTAGCLMARDYKGFGNQAMTGILEPNNLKYIGAIGETDRVGDGKKLSRNCPSGNRVYDSNGIAVTQTAQGGGLGGATGSYLHEFRIRKLTPRECFRLMGVDDSDIDKIQSAGISNTQQYKMAGNSIVVDCMAFLKELDNEASLSD